MKFSLFSRVTSVYVEQICELLRSTTSKQEANDEETCGERCDPIV